ncbi:MAG: dTDP-4-dehydrorhamnose reductase [Alphaproteobacteria bacterium]|nr:dTDP-4-dehydrorhamnose reductase [Alphaproteobacteria bacterium]
MQDKILITGANGQLGKELSKLLPDAVLTDVAELDITDLSAVQTFVRDNHIGWIVNCAAYTAVDKAEDDKELSEKINVTGPENLAKSGAKVIHISTDYVFDGLGHKPYEPTDETKPISVYGKTKRAGELAVLENANTAIIIRTAWLYSTHGNNFVKTMRRLGSERETLNVVADQIGSPTYAGDLAVAITEILPQIQEGQKGVYHFTNEGVCSWYDFAGKIMELSGLRCTVNPIPSSAYPTKATRPFYSVLSKEAIKADFGIKIAHWEDGLKRCLNEMEKTK